METTSQVAALIATVFAVVGPVTLRGQFARRHAWILAIQEQAATEGLSECARTKLRDEAAQAILWDLARRNNPGKGSLIGPLIAMTVLAPILLVATFPLNTDPGWAAVRPFALAAFVGTALWMTVQLVRSLADMTRWKLSQCTDGADIDEIDARTICAMTARSFSAALRPRGRAQYPDPFVAIVCLAEAQQSRSNGEHLPDHPELDDLEAWEKIAKAVSPGSVNTIIADNQWQYLRA